MTKSIHEVRDPIHVFVRLDSEERNALNSPPFQRLRHIHQLALTYLVYPGATHKRFEHSLGVMELAGRVFDVVTNPDHLTDEMRDLLPDLNIEFRKVYWRRAIRMAALFHDVGHLPFSHAAEKELLPSDWNHEKISAAHICSAEMRPIWETLSLNPEDVAKLALGPEKAPTQVFSNLERVLSEIIVGDAFGVDRMDYLLRDSHHIGVAYGNFDHHRLIDTLRILPQSASDEGDQTVEPTLGIDHGGLQSAEALIIARYMMYSQVYFHPTRIIYDIHLLDFLKKWLPQNQFPTDISDHLKMTDNEVMAAIYEAAFDPSAGGYKPARNIIFREHYQVIWERNPSDLDVNTEAGINIFEAAVREFGEENIRNTRYSEKGGAKDFPVRLRDKKIYHSISLSKILGSLPVFSVDYVFADRSILKDAFKWLSSKKNQIIQIQKETNHD